MTDYTDRITAEMERRARRGQVEAQISPDERVRLIGESAPDDLRFAEAMFTAPQPAGAVEAADFSHWNGEINFDLLPPQYRQIITKATEGTWFTDGKCARNVAEARRTGREAGVYHFARPDYSAQAQIDYFLSVAEPLQPDPSCWFNLDFEITGGLDGRSLNSWLWIACDRLIRELGWTRIYTNLATMNKLSGDISWIAERPIELWVASWGSLSPTIPAPWTDWVIWQDAVLPKGSVPGVLSAMDHNWSRAEVGPPPDPPPDPDPEPEPGAGLRYRVTAAPHLNLRDAPRLSAADIGDLQTGETVEVLEVSAPVECWLKVRRGNGQIGWAALKYNGNQLMEKA